MSRSASVDDFDTVFREVKELLKLTFEEAAGRIDVSKKTLETWLKHPPNVHRRRAIVAAFPDVPRPLRARLAASLGIPPGDEAAKPDTALLKAALEGALFEAAETLDAPARDVRKAFGLLLARVAGLGIDVQTASALLVVKRGE